MIEKKNSEIHKLLIIHYVYIIASFFNFAFARNLDLEWWLINNVFQQNYTNNDRFCWVIAMLSIPGEIE